eukprot:6172784-Pleurochrysis_carterae.AAC.1
MACTRVALSFKRVCERASLRERERAARAPEAARERRAGYHGFSWWYDTPRSEREMLMPFYKEVRERADDSLLMKMERARESLPMHSSKTNLISRPPLS